MGALDAPAVKYGGATERINVAIVEAEGKVVVTVDDAGIGLAIDAKERVFEAFFRAEKAEETATGVGLGLTGCKRLIEPHVGRIWVETEPARTLFRFALPILRDAGLVWRAVSHEPAIVPPFRGRPASRSEWFRSVIKMRAVAIP